MARTLAFLGLDGLAEQPLALAAARAAALSGAKTLLITQHAADWVLGALGHTPTTAKGDPIELIPNLSLVQARTTDLVERNWNRIRALEEEYLRTPIFKNVYGQELGVVPGFDELFLLLALRDWDQQYDVLVLSLSSDHSLLRMLAAPDQLGWYTRRFQEAFKNSPISLALSPFWEPLTRAVMAGTVEVGQKGMEFTGLLQRAQQAARKQVMLFLVSDQDPLRIRQAQRLWGSAELFELQVVGLLTLGDRTPEGFDPLPTQALGTPKPWMNWEIPDLAQMAGRLSGLAVDTRLLTVRVFLPGYEKKEIELSQDGPELTLRVGDQRRNLSLPEAFRGKRVRGAKFADSALLMSFG